MDKVNRERRSQNMARIPSKNTAPELAVRSAAHRMGYRFRLHRDDLPGRPDLVFPRRGIAIFVHGCFWHQHRGCPDGRLPKSRCEYWIPKLQGNKLRDRRNQRQLGRRGWTVAVIWECETHDAALLSRKLRRLFGPGR